MKNLKKRIAIHLAEKWLNFSFVRVQYKDRFDKIHEGDVLLSKEGFSTWYHIVTDHNKYISMKKINKEDIK